MSITELQSAPWWSKLVSSLSKRYAILGEVLNIPLLPVSRARWYTPANMTWLEDSINHVREACGVSGLPLISIPYKIADDWHLNIRDWVLEANGFPVYAEVVGGGSVNGAKAQELGGHLWTTAYGSSGEAQQSIWNNWDAYRDNAACKETFGSASWGYGSILSCSQAGGGGYYGLYDSDWLTVSGTAQTLFPCTGTLMVKPSRNFFTLPAHQGWTPDHDWTVIPFSGEGGMVEGEWFEFDNGVVGNSAGLLLSDKWVDRCTATAFPGYNLNWNVLTPEYYIYNRLTVEYNAVWLMYYDFGDEI